MILLGCFETAAQKKKKKKKKKKKNLDNSKNLGKTLGKFLLWSFL